MNNELHTKNKKKFSIGAIFCLLAALCIAGFSAWGLVAEGLTMATNLYYCFSTMLEWPLLIHQVVLLTNAVSNLVAMCTTLLTFGAAIALAFLAVAMLLKINSRFIGIACALPVLATLLSVLMPLLGGVFRFILVAPYDSTMAGNTAVTMVLGGLATVIPAVFSLISWLAMGAAMIFFGGGKKYSSKKTTLALILGAIVAFLFVVASTVSLATGLITNGMSLISYVNNILLGNAVVNLFYVIENFGSTLYLILSNSAIGVMLALAGFFTVKWVVAPFKKTCAEEQKETAE